MKKVLGIFVAAVLLIGSAASAQTSVSLPDLSSGISATFYDSDPYDGGELVESDFTVTLTDSSVGKAIDLDGDADYIVLEIDGIELAFETTGVTTTNSTVVEVNDGDNLQLSEVVSAIYDAAEGETELAIFTDDGIVTGFYSHQAGVDTNIDISDADTLIVASADQA